MGDRQTRVWIAQCLCPQRHCIMAAVAEAVDLDEATKAALKPLQATLTEALRSGALNPWCSLCGAGSDRWSVEVGRTPFSSLDEARPRYEQLEREQAATRALFGDMPRSD